jgi:hypothetical protein
MMIDSDRLATAMVAAFRSLAKQKWPWVAGDGWPAYSERINGQDTSFVLLVGEIAEAVAQEYEVTPDAAERMQEALSG